jgi:hypothetical protein
MAISDYLLSLIEFLTPYIKKVPEYASYIGQLLATFGHKVGGLFGFGKPTETPQKLFDFYDTDFQYDSDKSPESEYLSAEEGYIPAQDEIASEDLEFVPYGNEFEGIQVESDEEMIIAPRRPYNVPLVTETDFSKGFVSSMSSGIKYVDRVKARRSKT